MAILTGLLVFLASCSSEKTKKTGQKTDNIVLIIIDTLRQDRLGCYGYPLPTSPHIDALAAEGVVFEQAVTTVPLTLPSIATILTSTYPIHSNVRHNGRFFLSDSSETLAEVLKKHGYQTAAFVGGFPIHSRFKLDQGFDVYDDDFSNSAVQMKTEWSMYQVDDFERTAGEVNERVFDWLEQVKDDRFFLMVHYFDPHWSYEPPSPFKENFKNSYDGEVAYTDEQLGNLLDKLSDMGLKEDCLIVLTADHGEGLGDHNEETHGEYIFDTTMLIPLILYREGALPKGRRVDTLVTNMDIMPTLLDIVGIVESPPSQGESLLRALNENPKERPILLESMFRLYLRVLSGVEPMRTYGLRTGEWKLVYETLEKDGRTLWKAQLYDLSKDPGELNNVADAYPEIFNSLLKEMQSNIEALSVEGRKRDNLMEMDKETHDKLKSLGYLG